MFAVLSSPFHVERLWGFLFSVDSFCSRDGASCSALCAICDHFPLIFALKEPLHGLIKDLVDVRIGE
jgi:hypothetical protein